MNVGASTRHLAEYVTDALRFDHLTTDIDDTNATVYTTGSFTSTSGRPLYVGVLISDTNPAGTPTLAKTGVTLTLRASVEYDAAGTRRSIFLFSGTPTSTSTGTLTITATEDVSGCGWTIFEAPSTSGPIVGTPVTNTSGGAAGTAINATLPAFASGDNAAIAVMSVDVDGSFTSDFTILGQDQSAGAAPVQCIAAAWKGNDNTVTATGPNGLWGVIAAEVSAVPAAVTNAAVNQATETDTAQAVARIKQRAVGQTEETAAAQTIRPQELRSVGQVVSAETAATITPADVRPVGQATETDAAQPVSRLKQKAAAQAVETDAAQVVTARKLRATGQATTTEIAGAITARKVRTIGQATEADAATPLARRIPVGQATETSTARALSKRKTAAIGLATETDTALSVSVLQVLESPFVAELTTTGRLAADVAASGGQVALTTSGRQQADVTASSGEADLTTTGRQLVGVG